MSDLIAPISSIRYVNFKKNDIKLAEYYFLKSIDLDPKNSYSWGGLAGVELVKGNNKKAIECLKEALKYSDDTQQKKAIENILKSIPGN